MRFPRFLGGFRSWSTGTTSKEEAPMAAPRKYPLELKQRAVRLWRDS